MRKSWIVIQASNSASMCVIRFRPGGAYPFLDFAVEGLNDTVDHLDDVFGRVASSLKDRILEAPTVDARMAAVEGWLLERARGRLDFNPAVEHLAGRLSAPSGIRIADVVEDLGYSQRHVRNLFRKWVGLSPKEFGSLRRFQQVLTSLARGAPPMDFEAASELRAAPLPEPDWADLAPAHGYYDQSHLIHDFRRYAGMTPREYAASFRGLENYLPVD